MRRAQSSVRSPSGVKARAPLHQEDAEHFLELLDAGRECRLGDARGLRGASEMAFAGQGHEIF
jgi:hypothetical protein